MIYRIYLGYYSLAFAVRPPYFKNEIDQFLPPSNANFLFFFPPVDVLPSWYTLCFLPLPQIDMVE